jgi:signal transduction histidine kinase
VLPKSIRWRLPLSYAGIALLATLALGIMLLTTLRSYYTQRELDHLYRNGAAISRIVDEMLIKNVPIETVKVQLEYFSLFSQSKIRLLDNAKNVIAESNSSLGPHLISFTWKPGTNPIDKISKALGIQLRIQPLPSNEMADFPPPLEYFTNSEFQPDQNFVTSRLFIAGTPYGMRLDPDRMMNGEHSDQSIITPLNDSRDHLLGYLEVSEGPAYGTEIVNSVAQTLLGAGVFAIVIAAFAGWYISQRITSPLLGLTQVTANMASGNLSARAKIDLKHDDEFSLLSRSFNDMANQVENTVQTLRHFIADAAHELHTPLTALRTNLELAATDRDDKNRITFVERGLGQVKRLETLTNSLLDLSRIESNPKQEERSIFDLVTLIQESSELYASQAEQAGITFNFNLPDDKVLVNANESQIRRALCNLLDNAIKFTPEEGEIQVGVCHKDAKAELWVQDTGIGIPVEDLPYIFSRFHRGRNAAAFPGNGLGLAIIKAVAESHKGMVNVESKPNSGTRFSLQLPLATSAT